MLTEYTNAPVAEVGLAMYFEPLPFLDNFNLSKRAIFLQTKNDLPFVNQTIYNLTSPEEQRGRQSQQLNFHQGVPRSGFQMSSGDRIWTVQFQDNRFSITWKKQLDSLYPRFELIFEKFKSLFEEFCSGSPELGVLQPKITQCGIQYVNLLNDDNLAAHKNLTLIDLSNLNNHEDILFQTRHKLNFKDGSGRFYLFLQTIFNFEKQANGMIEEKRKLNFSLTARGKPNDGSIENGYSFLKQGRKLIIEKFGETLSPSGKKKFGEQDVKK